MSKLEAKVRSLIAEAPPDSRQLPFEQVGCVLHKSHRPKPTSSVLHHVYPLYLQKERWPDVDPDRPGTAHDKERVPVCADGHYDVHAALDALLDGRERPEGAGVAEVKLAGEAVLRHQKE